MKKFILLSPKNRTTYNYRGDLMKSIQKLGYEVIVTGTNKDALYSTNGAIAFIGYRLLLNYSYL